MKGEQMNIAHNLDWQKMTCYNCGLSVEDEKYLSPCNAVPKHVEPNRAYVTASNPNIVFRVIVSMLCSKEGRIDSDYFRDAVIYLNAKSYADAEFQALTCLSQYPSVEVFTITSIDTNDQNREFEKVLKEMNADKVWTSVEAVMSTEGRIGYQTKPTIVDVEPISQRPARPVKDPTFDQTDR